MGLASIPAIHTRAQEFTHAHTHACLVEGDEILPTTLGGGAVEAARQSPASLLHTTLATDPQRARLSRLTWVRGPGVGRGGGEVVVQDGRLHIRSFTLLLSHSFTCPWRVSPLSQRHSSELPKREASILKNPGFSLEIQKIGCLLTEDLIWKEMR